MICVVLGPGDTMMTKKSTVSSLRRLEANGIIAGYHKTVEHDLIEEVEVVIGP